MLTKLLLEHIKMKHKVKLETKASMWTDIDRQKV
jgi:hypothetical protein